LAPIRSDMIADCLRSTHVKTVASSIMNVMA
jgi:hypothetical protein